MSSYILYLDIYTHTHTHIYIYLQAEIPVVDWILKEPSKIIL